jgi:outer membrane protein assembly factor BamB
MKEWRIDKNISDASPVVDNNGIIYIRSRHGIFYAINPEGTIRWQSKLDGSPINYSAAIDRQGIIYIASRDGYLYAFGK